MSTLDDDMTTDHWARSLVRAGYRDGTNYAFLFGAAQALLRSMLADAGTDNQSGEDAAEFLAEVDAHRRIRGEM